MLKLGRLGKGCCRLKNSVNFPPRLFWLVTFLVFIADQATKLLVRTSLLEQESIPLLPGILHITYVRNPGAAFGVLAHHTGLFIAITLIVLSLLVYFCYRLPLEQGIFRLGLALQAGGAAGNLLDRIRTGLVIDFIDFRVWPVFNLADTAITIGVVILVYCLLFGSEDADLSTKEPVSSRD